MCVRMEMNPIHMQNNSQRGKHGQNKELQFAGDCIDSTLMVWRQSGLPAHSIRTIIFYINIFIDESHTVFAQCAFLHANTAQS